MPDLASDLQDAARNAGIGARRRASVLPFAVLGLAAASIGALLAWVMDPQLGRTRRAVTRDRLAGSARRFGRWSARRGRWLGSTAAGIGERLQHATPLDQSDVTGDEVDLANRVKSELFRDPGIDKGGISINAEGSVVFLRGTAPHPDDIRMIEDRVRDIAGVERVVNLLHLPGTPVPVMDAERDDVEARTAVPG